MLTQASFETSLDASPLKRAKLVHDCSSPVRKSARPACSVDAALGVTADLPRPCLALMDVFEALESVLFFAHRVRGRELVKLEDARIEVERQCNSYALRSIYFFRVSDCQQFLSDHAHVPILSRTGV